MKLCFEVQFEINYSFTKWNWNYNKMHGKEPVQTFISSTFFKYNGTPPPVTVDGRYIARHLGTALRTALVEIAEYRPSDPVEYLAYWLYKYRKNTVFNTSKEELLNSIRLEEEVVCAQEQQRAKILQEEKQFKIEATRKLLEELDADIIKTERERPKKIKESQKSSLLMVTEELENDSYICIERDMKGQTELHKLAGQEGADLVALFNMGYSLADRDENNKTPRDIAEDSDIQENIDVMDSYIANMIEQEKLHEIQQLLLHGYDKLAVVLSQVSTDGLPDEVTQFLNAVPEFQSKIRNVFTAVESGVVRDVAQYLDRSKLAKAKDDFGRSPLHVAVLLEHKDVVGYITKHFPESTKCRDNLNRTPLHYAAALSEELTAMIIHSEKDNAVKDVKNRTPSMYITEKDDIIQLQASFKLRVKISDETGKYQPNDQIHKL